MYLKDNYRKKINSILIVVINTKDHFMKCPKCNQNLDYGDRVNYVYLECPDCDYYTLLGDISEVHSN